MSISMLRTPGRYSQIRGLSYMVTKDDVFSEANRIRVHRTLKEKTCSGEVPHWARGREMRRAAVLVPLCTIDGEPSILFTVRSAALRRHKGEVSFPGGLRDEADPDYVHTALRETEEEMGISRDRITLWGTMNPVPGKNFETFVTPVIGYLGEVDIKSINHSEEEKEKR